MKNRTINIFLITVLLLLPIYLIWEIYFIDKFYFICPVEYKRDIVVRSDSRGDGDFFTRRNGNRRHAGIDLEAPEGTKVRAVKAGRILEASFHRGLGNYVEILHPDRLVTIYGHLSKIHTKKGSIVRQGQVIGEVGKTGNANHPLIQPHLHFEIRDYGKPLNPSEYLD